MRDASRCPPRFPRAVIAAATLAIGLCAPHSAAAGDLQIAARMLPCRDEAAIADEILSRIGPSMAAQPALRLFLDGLPDNRLTIRLEGARRSLQRTVRFSSGDCDALASATLLLLRDWLQRDWTPLPTDASAADQIAQPDGVASARSPDLQPADRSPDGTLSVTALAGAFVSPGDRRLGPAASLGASHGLTPALSFGLAAAYQGLLSQPIDRGVVSVQLFHFDATLSTALLRGDRHGLDFATGPALALLHVHSDGFPISRSATIPELAWVAALRYRLRLFAHISWVSCLQLDARSRSDVIRVVGAADLSVAPIRLSLTSGLAWNLP